MRKKVRAGNRAMNSLPKFSSPVLRQDNPRSSIMRSHTLAKSATYISLVASTTLAAAVMVSSRLVGPPYALKPFASASCTALEGCRCILTARPPAS